MECISNPTSEQKVEQLIEVLRDVMKETNFISLNAARSYIQDCLDFIDENWKV
jgi:hypothetical protein